jgi:hypothetical protein
MSSVLEASVVASFADGTLALVSRDDSDLSALRWRRDSYGYVVRSQGKQNITLARTVADRAGIAPGGLRFTDGDQLNCTRENIYLKRPGLDRRGLARRGHTRQPEGLHRFQLRLPPKTGYVPPAAYRLAWHENACEWTAGITRRSGSSCALAETGRLAGVAVRRTRVTGPGQNPRTHPGGLTVPDGWEFTDLTGARYPTRSYDEGCRWVLAGLDLAVRYRPALSQGAALQLIASMEEA